MTYEYLIAINFGTPATTSNHGYNQIARIGFTCSIAIDSIERINHVEKEIADSAKKNVANVHLLSFQLLRIVPDDKPVPSDINITDNL